MPVADRARVVAEIRALAEFIEVNPTLPVPNYVRAQYTCRGTADSDAVVRAAAYALGSDIHEYGGHIFTTRHLAGGPPDYGPLQVVYGVHGTLPPADPAPAAAAAEMPREWAP